jgi:conjugal transfer pilus assembly protein TraB
MIDIKKKCDDLADKVRKYFVGTDKLESKNKTARKKWLNLGLVIIGAFITFIVILLFIASNEKKQNTQGLGDDLASIANNSDGNAGGSNNSNLVSKHQKIELGTDAIKGEVKWQNFLEESIETEGKTREEQISILKESINKHHSDTREESDSEFKELKDRFSYLVAEIESLKAKNANLENEVASLSPEEEKIMPAELGITVIDTRISVKPPISSYNHIPATSYVSGHLLGGIAVSTSVTSASEPIPVIIKLTDRGNLPKKFAVDVTECRLLASAYGDISSERAIVRAEELVCENKAAGLITTTKVSGVIYGDDGANGIRGIVVSMSDKHLKSAAIGGVLSGFSQTAKGKSGLNVTALGAVSTKSKGMKDMAQDGLLSGASSAAEKLADYHIKLAENISPVILVPGGTKVDVMFTKSVEIGSTDIEEVIKSERVGQ